MKIILLVAMAYLCGSVPFGKLTGRLYHVDIQKRGSGNIGFANVQRVLGWRAGLMTLTGDIVKGSLPTWLALQTGSRTLAFWVGMAAIAGHVFPVWLRGKGGKGVATGLGVVAILQPLAAATGASLYIAGRLTIKNSAYSSLIGIVGVLIVGCTLQYKEWWYYGLLLLTALWTLRHNIKGTVPNYDV